MKDITTISNGSTMSSADLYALICQARSLASETTPRLNDFHARIVDELEGDHYESFVVQNPNKTETTYYRLTIEQCLYIGMRESKAVRRSVTAKLKELEENQPPTPPAFQIPQTLAEALQLAADQAKQIELQAPKVAFVEKLVERENLLNATQVAQPHKLSAVKLNRILDDVGGIYNKSVKRGRAFCQAWIDAGYGELKVTESGHNQCLFTVKGEQRINEILISEGIV